MGSSDGARDDKRMMSFGQERRPNLSQLEDLSRLMATLKRQRKKDQKGIMRGAEDGACTDSHVRGALLGKGLLFNRLNV